MEYTVDNGHTNLRHCRHFSGKLTLIRRLMRASVFANGGDSMIDRSEACNPDHQACFVNQLSQLHAALTEISIAALTTEPEVRDMARSLISLAKYHAQRMTGSIADPAELENSDSEPCVPRHSGVMRAWPSHVTPDHDVPCSGWQAKSCRAASRASAYG